jgi:hypothetical protein
MKLFEIINQNQQNISYQNMMDDDENGIDINKINNNLQDIAQNVQDQDAQPDLPQGAQTEPPEMDPNNMKPIDDALIGKIKNLPYNTNWQHDDDSKLSPINIAKMNIADLNSLRNKVRLKMQLTDIKNQPGMQTYQIISYCNDLIRFIDTVIDFKKSNTKSQMAQFNPLPSYKQQG